jgi:hypothetical protein
MEDLPLIFRVAEVVVMEVLVGAAVVALLIAAVRDIVEAKVQESRRRDQIALEPKGQTPPVPQGVAQKPVAVQPARLST